MHDSGDDDANVLIELLYRFRWACDYVTAFGGKRDIFLFVFLFSCNPLQFAHLYFDCKTQSKFYYNSNNGSTVVIITIIIIDECRPLLMDTTNNSK